MLYADLTVNNNGMPDEYDNLTKPAGAPSVEGGILWADTVNKYFYLYGGDFYQSSPSAFALWQYDAIYSNWTSVNPDPTQASIERASFGAGTVAEDSGIGYYYGGWITNQSVPAFGANPVALSNLLSYDMLTNTWSNSSGIDSTGRAEGVMVYLPASDGGMLIYFGGVQVPSGNGSEVAQPMDVSEACARNVTVRTDVPQEIIIYDIANAKWYTQKATGNVPESRRRFCAGATWPKDQSSYNIYLYGGASVGPGDGFDDVYILTLPTFEWIKCKRISPPE